MAFKKGQRQVTVSPTGMPNLSGYSQLARQYDQMAQTMYSIGSDMRKENLNDLLLEAEASGRTAGARYEDGRLVPLTNLDVGANIADRAVGEKERRAVQAMYRKTATQTYVSSVANDSATFADNVFQQNPNDPTAIRGAYEGYVEGLNMPQELQPYVMGDITSSFIRAENRARANQRKEQKAESERVALAAIDRIAENKSILNSVGAGTDPDRQASFEETNNDFNAKLEENYQLLRETNGYTDSMIEALNQKVNEKVALRIAEAHVERFYFANGGDVLATNREIQSLFNEYRDDPNIDAGQAYLAMNQALQRLEVIATEEKRATVKAQTDNYNDANLGIALGEITSLEQIADLDITIPQRTALIQSINSRIQGKKSEAEADRKEAINEQFGTAMLVFESAFPDPVAVQNAEIEIQQMRENGLINATQYGSFLRKRTALTINAIKANGDAEFANINRDIRNGLIASDDLVGMTPLLQEKGYIGTEKGSIYTLTQWDSLISRYKADETKRNAQATKVMKARKAVLNGRGTAEDIKILSETSTFAMEADDEGGTLFSTNPEIREANQQRAIRFALTYKHFPPEVTAQLQGLNALSQNEQAFADTINLWSRMHQSLKNGSLDGGVTDLAMGELQANALMQKHGINPMDFEIARLYGFKQYFDNVLVSNTVNPTRLTNNIEEKFAMPLDQVIATNLPEAVEGRGFFEYLGDAIGFTNGDERSKQIIEQLIASVGYDVDEAVINDPRMMFMVKQHILSSAAKGRPVNEDTIQIHIRDAIVSVSDMVGVTTDSEGNAQFGFMSFIKEANAEIGDAAVSQPTQDIVFDDIRYKIKSNGLPLSERAQYLLDNDGVITLEPETYSGKNQTYLVKISDPDTGETYNIREGYRFQWDNSQANAIHMAAVKRVQNSTVKAFMANSSFFKRGLIEKQFSNILGDINNDANWLGMNEPDKMIGIMELMHSLNQTLNPFAELAPEPDARDVMILRDFLAGRFSEEEYLEQLDSYDE